MSRDFKDWFVIVLTALFLFGMAWKYLGFEVAKSLIGFSNYPALIITGGVAIVLGINRSKWSALFSLVALILIVTGL